LGAQGQQLLTERQILEHEILARAERVDAQPMRWRRAVNIAEIIATPALQPNYKSFILDSHNVLIRHTRKTAERKLLQTQHGRILARDNDDLARHNSTALSAIPGCLCKSIFRTLRGCLVKHKRLDSLAFYLRSLPEIVCSLHPEPEVRLLLSESFTQAN
jgi:hypothetical protein